MKFLRTLIENLEVLYRFHVELFDAEGDKVDEVDVIAGNEKEAEKLAIHKSTNKGRDAVTALAMDKEDIK